MILPWFLTRIATNGGGQNDVTESRRFAPRGVLCASMFPNGRYRGRPCDCSTAPCGTARSSPRINCAAGWLSCRSAEVRIAVRMISEPSDRHVRLVAEVALAVLLRPAGLGVALADRAFFHRRRLDRGLQQRRVDQCALAHDQPAGTELAVDLLEQCLGQPVRRQLLAKAPDRRMVGNALV